MDIVIAKEQCYLLGLAYYFQTYALHTMRKFPVSTTPNAQMDSHTILILGNLLLLPSKLTKHHIQRTLHCYTTYANSITQSQLSKNHAATVSLFILKFTAFLISETTTHLNVFEHDLLPPNFPQLYNFSTLTPRPHSTTLAIQNVYYIIWFLQTHNKIATHFIKSPPKWSYTGWIFSDNSPCRIMLALKNTQINQQLITHVLPLCPNAFRQELLKLIKMYLYASVNFCCYFHIPAFGLFLLLIWATR